MYIYSLVGVFCFRHFSVKQQILKFTSFCVDILITVLARVLKNGEINILDCNFSHQGNASKYTTLNMVLFLHLIG